MEGWSKIGDQSYDGNERVVRTCLPYLPVYELIVVQQVGYRCGYHLIILD